MARQSVDGIAFVKQSTFSMRELKEGKATLYVVLPAGQGESYKPWLRMLFNAAFDAMQDMSIPKPQEDVLFVMDEFPLLGKMERIKRAAGEAAKFGVKLFICAQGHHPAQRTLRRAMGDVYRELWRADHVREQ